MKHLRLFFLATFFPLLLQPAYAADDPYAYLGEGKRTALVRMAAEHIEIIAPGKVEVDAQLLAQEKKILGALADVLDPKGTVAKTFVTQHHALTKRYFEGFAAAPYGYESLIGKEVSKESVDSIVLNRAADLRALKNLLTVEELQTSLNKNKGTRAERMKSFPLNAAKEEDLVQTLLQEKQFERGEPAVHIYHTAMGHMLGHAILADSFESGGEVEKVMVEELQKKLPEMEPEVVKAIAKNYMQDRWHAAKKIVKAFQLDSDVVNEAIKRSKITQRQFDLK